MGCKSNISTNQNITSKNTLKWNLRFQAKAIKFFPPQSHEISCIWILLAEQKTWFMLWVRSFLVQKGYFNLQPIKYTTFLLIKFGQLVFFPFFVLFHFLVFFFLSCFSSLLIQVFLASVIFWEYSRSARSKYQLQTPRIKWCMGLTRLSVAKNVTRCLLFQWTSDPLPVEREGSQHEGKCAIHSGFHFATFSQHQPSEW